VVNCSLIHLTVVNIIDLIDNLCFIPIYIVMSLERLVLGGLC